MLVSTTRFGQIDVGQEHLILFPLGIIGFESCRHWIVLPDVHNPDVAWLQSVSQGQVALPVISPRKFLPEYKVTVARRQLACLALHNSDRVFILTVVSKTGKTLTTNLRSPLILNMTQRLGCQAVTNDDQPLAMALNASEASRIKLAA